MSKKQYYKSTTPIYTLSKHHSNTIGAILLKKDMTLLKLLGRPYHVPENIQNSADDIRPQNLIQNPYESLITSVQRAQWVASIHLRLLLKSKP